MTGKQDKTARTADALKTLADGFRRPEMAGPSESGPPAPGSDEEELVGGQEASGPAEGFPAQQDGRSVRKARAASLHQQSRIVRTHQYKRTMIPLLLVVGVLLLILGAGTLLVLLADSGGGAVQYEMQRSLLGRYGRHLAVMAMPLGMILLLGAWLFYRDVRRN